VLTLSGLAIDWFLVVIYRTQGIFMRFIILILFIFTAELSAYSSDEIIGEKLIVHSKVIGEDRPISVYIPTGVKEGEPLYVIYLLDSQHHFHTVTGIVQSLVNYKQIPKTMVVGIETTNRPRDYLPKVNGKPKTNFQAFALSKWPDSGQEKFLGFIEKELFPFIDKNYATYPHRTLIGHSNGGTLALSAMFESPELFNNYLAISANGWWSYDEVVENSLKLTDKARASERLFISVSGEGGRFYTGTLELLSNMEKNKPSNLDWQFKHYPEHTHMSGILPAVSEGLEYLYDHLNFRITPQFAKYAKISVIKNYYSELSKQSGFNIPIPTNTYVAFAEQQQINERNEAALSTLTQFTVDYPNLPYAHMSLAQGYTKSALFKKAYESFKQALNIAKQLKLESNTIDALQDMVNTAQQKI
jgi:predicted alpha/beta superfamily hydrolase